MSPRSEFLAGVRAELPILLGVIPFGLVFGVIANGAGLSLLLAQATSSIIFAGASQFIAAPLLAGSVPALVVVLTVFVVNLRHVLYSASLAPYLKPLRPGWKWVLAYFLTDEAYLISIPHFHEEGDGRDRHWFLLGAGVTLWACWQVSTLAGLVLGAQLPAEWSLDFAIPLTFLSLLAPALHDRASWGAAIAAGVVAVAGAGLPYKLGLITAALAGIAVGLLLEARRR